MTNTTQSTNLYGVSIGTSSTNPFVDQFEARDPTPNDVNYPIQKKWLNTTTGSYFFLENFVTTNGIVSANWVKIFSANLVESLTGNSGGPVFPDTSHNINVVGDGTSIDIVGNPGTNTLTASTGSTVATSYVEDTGTAVPSGGVLNVKGGTDISTTGSGNTITIAFTGSSSPSIETIDGDTGSVTGTTVAFNALPQAGSSISFSGSGTTMLLNSTDANDNVLLGLNCGNSGVVGAGGGANCGLGLNALSALTSGSGNTAMGQFSASALTSSTGNSAFGSAALANSTSGNNNTAIGIDSLQTLLTGTTNTALGTLAGVNYIGAESNNIVIGNQGVASESNVIRIGTQGSSTAQQNSCYIAGITGVTVSNQAFVTIDTSTGQLGETTGGSGLAKAWGYFSTNGSGVYSGTLSSFNVSSISGSGSVPGYLVTLTSGFASTNYLVCVTVTNNTPVYIAFTPISATQFYVLPANFAAGNVGFVAFGI